MQMNHVTLELIREHKPMAHPDLDLQGTIRPGLDILANEIVIGLKKRSRFKANAAVYRKGLVLSLIHI